MNEGHIKDITNDTILKEVEFSNGDKKQLIYCYQC